MMYAQNRQLRTMSVQRLELRTPSGTTERSAVLAYPDEVVVMSVELCYPSVPCDRIIIHCVLHAW